MSLSGDKYETLEEVTMRLSHTVVKYKEEFVYIDEVSQPKPQDEDQIARVWITPLRGGPRQRKYLSSRHFDLSPPALGFAALNQRYADTEVGYFARTPARMGKQGLASGNLIYYKMQGWSPTEVGDIDEFVTYNPGFVDMLEGKYTPYEEAMSIALANEKPRVSYTILGRKYVAKIDRDLEMVGLFRVNKVLAVCQLEGFAGFKLPKNSSEYREEIEQAGIKLL